MSPNRLFAIPCAILIISACSSLHAQKLSSQGGSPEHVSDVEITGHIYKPVELPAPELSRIHVPSGFRIERFAENAGNARVLTVGPDGSVYLTRREEGDILMFKVGANGLASGPPIRVASRTGLHGLAISNGKVYIASVHEIFKADLLADGSFGPLEMIIHDLPDAGQHNTRMVQIGPDNMMYISVASTCNECSEPNAENAAILRASLDGKRRSIFASGLRDTIGWGWQPQTGELWGMDQGIDWLGDDNQPEELNRIEKGKRYGWPYVYAEGKINPHSDPLGGVSKSDWAKSSSPMVLGYTAHAAPMQLAFYTGTQFPTEFRGDAFVSMRGSWNRKPPSGYEVVRIHFENGQPVSIRPFVTGFVGPDGSSGRLVGSAIAKDGSLLFTDDRNGVIYRVSYTRATSEHGATALAVPDKPMLSQNHVGEKTPIAIEQLSAAARLSVSSPAFHDGAAIPITFSAYDQNASPALSWTAGPAGTKSYALLMEDPDSKSTPVPVIHWVAWNIPADTKSLREGLETLDKLQDPDGLQQGPNTAGSVGYRGPKPPAGDPPHHYHLQVFAVDRKLDLLPGAKRAELINQLKGHVLASGELVGLFARPDYPAKP